MSSLPCSHPVLLRTAVPWRRGYQIRLLCLAACAKSPSNNTFSNLLVPKDEKLPPRRHFSCSRLLQLAPTSNPQADSHRIALPSLQLLHPARSIAIRQYQGGWGDQKQPRTAFDAAARGAFIPSLPSVLPGWRKQEEIEVVPEKHQSKKISFQPGPHQHQIYYRRRTSTR